MESNEDGNETKKELKLILISTIDALLKTEKRKEAPFTWNMTGSRLVARSRTRTAWCLPGEPRRESRESIVTGEESGSKEGNVDIVPL